ncbi:MAG: tetratricopeptide repeat protein [Calditrichaceae bacterium]|nr:tetratricopeptide repeat protein [Calditrichaceae bacterium]MBN2708812.1 tetratricopeptide repeat protein [Calditrichaceae bacterium]RQV97659.1 MAG: tetratricopeptide repeat protein [Calditrichota bacterium]
MKKISKTILIILFFVFNYSHLNAQYTTESDDFSYPLKLYDQKFYDLAAQQFVNFYNKYPHSAKVADAKYYAGMSFMNIGNFQQARIEFQSLALEHPQSLRAAEGWFRAGQCYENLKNYSEAAKAYQSIRLLYPEHNLAAEGLYRSGVMHINNLYYSSALIDLGMLLERYVTSDFYFPALTKAGLAHLNLHELQQAKIKLDKVLSGNAKEITKLEAKLILARVYEQQGYLNDAKSMLEQIIQQDAKSEFALQADLILSRLYIQEKNYDKARQCLSRGLDHVTDAAMREDFSALLGDVYYLGGQYGLAYEQYLKVKPEKSDSLWIIMQLKAALSLKKQNLSTKAIDELKKIIESVQKEDEAIIHDLRLLYLNWLEESGKSEEALTFLYEMANKSDDIEEKAKLTLRIVKILNQTGNYRDIIRELQPFLSVQEKIPQKDDIVFYLADAFDKAGDHQESLHLFERLTTQYSASAYYQEALKKIQYLNDYNIINKDSIAFRQAELTGMSLLTNDRNKLLFELGKMYYSDLKAYEKAEDHFKQALQGGASNTGDLYLYLGKTYLKLAGRNAKNSDRFDENMLKNASENFKLAVENSGTCSSPDEASWAMIETTMMMDTVKSSQLKKYIDHLLEKFPKSRFREKWLETIAYSAAFDNILQNEAVNYYNILIDDFEYSAHHPVHLFELAKLIEGKEPEKALEIYRKIAVDYPASPQAAPALEEVARHYENNLKYQEANLLYTRLLNNYFYSDIAQEAKKKIGEIYVYAGEYDKAVELLEDQVNSPFISDYLLTREFMPEALFDNIYFLAKAYGGKNEAPLAIKYYKMYLNVAVPGLYRDHVYFDLGELFFNSNQYNIAVDYFNSISRDNETLFTQSRLYMAEIYFINEDYKKAADVYNSLKQVVTDPQKQPDIYGKQIIALLRAGEEKSAGSQIKEFKKKFSNQNDYEAQFVLEYGKYYRANKKYDQAIKFFNEVKKKYKSSSYADDADYFLALTYLTLNRNEEAYKILSGFNANYPKSDRLPAAYNSLGGLYFRGEKYDDAINMFKNGLLICKERELEQNLLSNLIKAYSFTGFWDAALATAKQYVEKFPEAADKIDKKIVIGRAYTSLNQFQNAVDYLKQVKLEADSETEPEIQFYIGDALLKAGQYENAIAEFVKIPLLSKKTKLQWEASALYYSGQAYEKLGRIGDAIRMYQEIVQRPGIDSALKAEAQKRISQIKG